MTLDLRIPLGASRDITMRFPGQQLTETDWRILLDVLAAMRPALVEPSPRPAYSTDDLNDAASNLRQLAAIDPEASVSRVAFLRDLADRLDAHERETS